MDPITLIATALAAGAARGESDTASPAVDDAYAALRSLVRRRLGNGPDGEMVLAGYEQAPGVWRVRLRAELDQAGAGHDLDLAEAAEALMRLAGQAGPWSAGSPAPAAAAPREIGFARAGSFPGNRDGSRWLSSEPDGPQEPAGPRELDGADDRKRRARRVSGRTRAGGPVRLLVRMTGPAVLILASVLGTVLIARQSAVTVAQGARYATGQHPAGHAPGRSGTAYSPGAVTTAARVRTQAAGWIAQQVSPGALVSCDPAMCAALRAAGMQPVTLLVLPPRATEPLTAGLVVATATVRSQFGARLAALYAPEVIARFGSGISAIQVRYVPPAGASSVGTGRAARIAAGQQLLRNQNVTAAPAASAVLSAGDVDPRLLVTLAALAAQHGLSVAAFGDASPGVADVPLRQAEIGPGARASMQDMLTFLRAQRPPYLPARAGITRVAGGQYLLTVQFDAPSPPGLIP